MTVTDSKTTKPVNNLFAIVLVLLPALINVILYILHVPDKMQGGVTLLSLIVVLVLISLDGRELNKAGYDAPNRWWLFLIPVYLWRRDGIVGTKYRLFGVLSVLIYALAVWGYLHAFHQRDMAEVSCSTVSQLLKDDYKVDRTCQGVINVESIGGNKYRAEAVLDGGDTLNITIEDRGDTYWTEMRYPQL